MNEVKLVPAGSCRWLFFFEWHLWSKWFPKYIHDDTSSFYRQKCFRCGAIKEHWVR